MLVAVTAKSEISQCQKMLVRALRKRLVTDENLTIGFQGGRILGKVHRDDRLWFLPHLVADSSVPRHANAFGTSIRERASQIIVVEINPPIEGYTKQVAGLFAKDEENGDYVLLHRGRIGGGRKGIGKRAFADWFRGHWTVVRSPTGQVDEAVLIGRLNSPNFVSLLEAFVRQVDQFKTEVKLGRFTRLPRRSDRSEHFSPEFHGTKRGRRSSALEYESFHGLVINTLEEDLTNILGEMEVNIFNNRRIDLGVEVGKKLAQIFEVKSSPDQQSIYTAIGQLMVHSVLEPNVVRTIVIPEGLKPSTRKTLSLLNISVLEYRIVEGDVHFLTKIPALAVPK